MARLDASFRLSPGRPWWRAVPALLFWFVAALAPLPLLAGDEVYLYVSPTSREYYPRIGGNYEAMVGPWRKMLAAKRIAVREIGQPADLAQLREGVLILPSAVALNNAERQALLRFRDAGGSMLATWGLGSRDSRGNWLGHDFVRELLGFSVAGELEKDSLKRFLVPFGDTPVNRSVPAGRRIWIGERGERPLLLKGGAEAAAYLDWGRTTLRVGDHASAIVFDEGGKGAGRRVMFGFAETAWDFHPEDIQALANDAIHWLRRVPAAHMAAWPAGYRAVQLIEMDTEEGFANAIHFAEVMEQMNAAGTFYCLTSEARRQRELVRRLAQRHEIGYHGEVHIGFKGLAREKQEKRIERMLADMKDITGNSDGWATGVGRGFRAPTESYDDATEILLQAMGLRHHTADPNSSQDRLPFFSPVASPDPASALVVLPRGQFDDLNYQHAGLDQDKVAAALIAEYELNLRMGGLAILSVHSQNFSDPERLLKPNHTALMTRAMEGLARHIGPRHEKVWIAPGGKIADWWRDRARAVLSSEGAGRRLDANLRVSGKDPVRGLTVLVALPAENAKAVVMAADSRSPAPEIRQLDRFTAALVFAVVPPGQHGYRIEFR